MYWHKFGSSKTSQRPTYNRRIVFSIDKHLRQKIYLRNCNDTLNCVMKCVNYVTARPLNLRLFSCLCDEMGANHIRLLLHTEVRWLSGGQVLKRVYELCEEIVTFLNKQNHAFLAEKFTANITDIHNSQNSLNQSMQGTKFTVSDHAAKITAYYKNFSCGKLT